MVHSIPMYLYPCVPTFLHSNAAQTEKATSLEAFNPVPGERYALVFGNEVDGVQQSVVDASDGALVIPQFGSKHSLNVSVSIGVVLWHFIKRFRT